MASAQAVSHLAFAARTSAGLISLIVAPHRDQ
jgi:hypothetical protein